MRKSFGEPAITLGAQRLRCGISPLQVRFVARRARWAPSVSRLCGWRRTRHPAHGTRRFTTCTDSVAAPRSKVAGEMFLAMTRTVLLDHAAASSSMNRVDDTSDAFARSSVVRQSPLNRSVPHAREQRALLTR